MLLPQYKLLNNNLYKITYCIALSFLMACGGGGNNDDSPSNVNNTPPIVSLTGNETLILHLGDTFSDPGATADDQEDGNISASITIRFGEYLLMVLIASLIPFSSLDTVK